MSHIKSIQQKQEPISQQKWRPQILVPSENLVVRFCKAAGSNCLTVQHILRKSLPLVVKKQVSLLHLSPHQLLHEAGPLR